MNTYPSLYNGTRDAFEHFGVHFEGRMNRESVIDLVGQAIKPHEMSVAGGRGEIDAALRSLKIGSLRIFYLQYGAEVQVDCDELESFTLVQMPVRGTSLYSVGQQLVSGGPDVAAILSPQESIQLQCSAELEQIIVRIEQKALERACMEHIELLPRQGLRFQPKLCLFGPAGQAWLATLSYILQVSAACPDLLARPAYCERWERLLIDTLLLAQPSNWSDNLNDMCERRTVRPAYVKRAEDYMRAHLAEATSVEQIARTVGVSPRALFYAFRQTHGQSPMSFLRDLRLKAVHAELTAGDPATTRLTEVALRWGFEHYGHFTSHYRRRFGVRPQDTLKDAGRFEPAGHNARIEQIEAFAG
ncbi:AraC family transcriptional regulator [Burkholderia cenocepacia]|uniref:AraC family transcriptional regulator n=1 Tax=Burkholderia cenocepacia TaxID=95486 RepID=UPI0012F50DA8|nr:AraC family transcriptional regulator [Burkholderia cenocepacia]